VTGIAGKALRNVFLMRKFDRLFYAPCSSTRPQQQTHRYSGSEKHQSSLNYPMASNHWSAYTSNLFLLLENREA